MKLKDVETRISPKNGDLQIKRGTKWFKARIYICDTCGCEGIENAANKGKNFCSQQCSAIANKTIPEEKAHYSKTGQRSRIHDKICANPACGKAFTTLNKTSRFCSLTCRSATKKKIAFCDDCGKLLEGKRRRRKYGSHKLLCADCQPRASEERRLQTIQERARGQVGTMWLAWQLLSHACVDCGEKRDFLLQIHHIDGDRWNNPPTCSNWEVVCVSCHILRHLSWKNGGWQQHSAMLTPRELLPFFRNGGIAPPPQAQAITLLPTSTATL